MNIVRTIPEKDRQVEVARAFADRQVTSDTAREVLKKVAREPTKPVQRLIREVAEDWRPWRSVATWYLWRSLDPIPVEY